MLDGLHEILLVSHPVWRVLSGEGPGWLWWEAHLSCALLQGRGGGLCGSFQRGSLNSYDDSWAVIFGLGEEDVGQAEVLHLARDGLLNESWISAHLPKFSELGGRPPLHALRQMAGEKDRYADRFIAAGRGRHKPPAAD